MTEGNTAVQKVAICVPACGKSDDLRNLLESLGNLDHPRSHSQLVIAVDGPDRELETLAHGHADAVAVLPKNRGSYAARNAAIELVDDDVAAVLFTDADAVVTPGWVASHLQALNDVDISAGHVEVTFQNPRPTMAELVDSVRFLDQQRLAEGLGYAATANMAVRPAVLRSTLFNPGLRSGGDRDFGARARAVGNRVCYTPEAVVTHPARPDVRALLRKVVRVARGLSLLERLGLLSVPVRSYARPPAVEVARKRVPEASLVWFAGVRVLDLTCSMVWAACAPATVFQSLRRKVDARRAGA